MAVWRPRLFIYLLPRAITLSVARDSPPMTSQARPWNRSWELATLTETLIELRGSNLYSSGVPVGSLAWLSVPNGAMMPSRMNIEKNIKMQIHDPATRFFSSTSLSTFHSFQSFRSLPRVDFID